MSRRLALASLLLASAPADVGAGVVRVEAGQETAVDAAAAQKEGLTIVDLSDEWVPYIFRDAPAPDGSGVFQSRYKSVYLGLADDRGDGDGQPLAPDEHNYLELYGIPPTLRVLRQRFLADADPGRCTDVAFEALKAVAYIPYREGKVAEKEAAKLAATGRRLDAERRRRGLESLAALGEADPRLAADVAAVTKFEAERVAFAEAEKRLACEGLFDKKAKHERGKFDEALRQALVRFQRKHKLYDAAAFKKETMLALGRTLLENDHAALLRVLTERVVAAADVVEDGSTDRKEGPVQYKDDKGQTVPLRNLVDEVQRAIIAALGVDAPDKALAFMKRHETFADYAVALRLPERPAYYTPHMDLSIEVDRGDVFYDPPFDEQGKPTNQSRHHFPMLTLRVRYNGQLVPLVRWRTTIGGWRSDLASNGYEYFRYKGSDVGPRVWRNIVAGPVWIAPNSTPVRTLVKYKTVAGTGQLVVNYDELGPGFLSAYGLVAAYNVVPGKDGKPDWDNGVRVHGSSEILSIRNPDAYSHGCHRLMNHLAVRLFGFVLHHRTMAVEGEKPLNFSRQFLWKDDIYELRMPSRGYYYRLEPPLPVNVLEGNVLGKLKKPITTYVPKPGQKYPPGPPPVPPDSPAARAGGGGAE